ncbi:MAG: VanZ family protein [Lachnospiraceae bacterium]
MLDKIAKVKHVWIRFLPALLMLLLIFGFSAQNDEESSETSTATTITIAHLIHIELDAETVEAISGVVRTVAHFTEYLLLAGTCFFAIAIWPMRPLVRYGGLELFCAVYAVSDELHQYYVPGRWCQWQDMLIDSMGAAFGLLLCFLWVHRRHR